MTVIKDQNYSPIIIAILSYVLKHFFRTFKIKKTNVKIINRKENDQACIISGYFSGTYYTSKSTSVSMSECIKLYTQFLPFFFTHATLKK